MTELPTAYLVPLDEWLGPDRRTSDFLMAAVTDDGDILGTHVCSSPGWARNDLHDAPFRHQMWIERFGGHGDGQFYRLVELAQPEDLPDAARARIFTMPEGQAVESE